MADIYPEGLFTQVSWGGGPGSNQEGRDRTGRWARHLPGRYLHTMGNDLAWCWPECPSFPRPSLRSGWVTGQRKGQTLSACRCSRRPLSFRAGGLAVPAPRLCSSGHCAESSHCLRSPGLWRQQRLHPRQGCPGNRVSNLVCKAEFLPCKAVESILQGWRCVAEKEGGTGRDAASPRRPHLSYPDSSPSSGLHPVLLVQLESLGTGKSP